MSLRDFSRQLYRTANPFTRTEGQRERQAQASRQFADIQQQREAEEAEKERERRERISGQRQRGGSMLTGSLAQASAGQRQSSRASLLTSVSDMQSLLGR